MTGSTGRPTRVLLVRHAEADCNVRDVFAGHRTCAGLTDRGRGQLPGLAAQVRELVGAEDDPVALTSVQRRAVQTALAVTDALGLPSAPMVCELCERHPGELDGAPNAEIRTLEQRDGLPASVESRPAFLLRARHALRRLAGHGAHVLVVAGDQDTILRLGLAACKKTAALEVVEQLGWRVPDVVVTPMGSGNTVVGLYQGFREARRLGWIDRVPRLAGVQAVGASALYRAWRSGAAEVRAVAADTVAGGIAIGAPLDGARAVHALRATGGVAVTVPDADILYPTTVLAAQEGVTAEPASAAALAALPELVESGAVGQLDRVVVLNTGDGRRGVDRDVVSPLPLPIPPRLSAVRKALAGLAEVPTDRVPAERRAGRLGSISPGSGRPSSS